MLNLFATTGHNNYAKSTRLYLQSISELQKNQPEVYNESIKQILMKSLKRRAGVVAKRINENVIHVWTKTMHRCAEITEAMGFNCLRRKAIIQTQGTVCRKSYNAFNYMSFVTFFRILSIVFLCFFQYIFLIFLFLGMV